MEEGILVRSAGKILEFVSPVFFMTEATIMNAENRRRIELLKRKNRIFAIFSNPANLDPEVRLLAGPSHRNP
jgi:hypothetical protein